MIEINLSPREKDNPIANLGGVNISLLNVKGLVLSIALLYISEPVLEGYYEDEEAKITAISNSIRKEQRKISTQLQELKHVKKQVEDLNRQETELSKKINVVKKIVDKRQNPFKVLRYIAENTPADVWIHELELDEKNLKLIGYSKSWKSISDFLGNLKSSVFFSETINYNRTSGVDGNLNGQRVEPFTITTSILRFE